MLNVNRLNVLHEVIAHGSFSEAADALSYSQSAVSQAIATLEGEAGVSLIERSRGGVRPTAAGAALAAHVEAKLGRVPLMLGAPNREVRRVAWCTGGAQGFFEAAIAAGADVYISGEVSEPTQHLALESGVGYLAAGHHATERGGARALGEHLASRFGLEHRFFDMPNPA